jgi:deoxycytidine triphosphate deaminase
MKKKGVLPSQMIEEMIEAGFILGTENIKKQINPASIDLSISEEVYRVEGIFLPRPNERVRDILDLIGAIPQRLDAVFEKDVTYLARLNEKLTLPQTIYGYANPKSSTGRNDIHVRLLADGVARYDSLPNGYTGGLWLAIKPRSYPIRFSFCERLNQLRLFNADTRFDETELEIAMARDKLLFYPLEEDRVLDYDEIKIRDNDGSLILTLDLTAKIVGYECRGVEKVLDFSVLDFSKRGINPENFFSKITKKNDYVFLKKKGVLYPFHSRSCSGPASLGL